VSVGERTGMVVALPGSIKDTKLLRGGPANHSITGLS
jgi:hypothetical protein